MVEARCYTRENFKINANVKISANAARQGSHLPSMESIGRIQYHVKCASVSVKQLKTHIASPPQAKILGMCLPSRTNPQVFRVSIHTQNLKNQISKSI